MKKSEVWFGILLLVVMAVLMQVGCEAGRHEHAEDVCLRMSQEDYDRINAHLGGEHNMVAIAEYYETHSRK